MQISGAFLLSIRSDIDWSAGSCSSDLAWYVQCLHDYYHGIRAIRISSEPCGLWYNLNKTGIEKFHSPLVIWEQKHRTIWLGVNLTEDQQTSILAGLFDGHPSRFNREGEVKGKMSFISFSQHPSLQSSPPFPHPISRNFSLFLQISCPPLPPAIPVSSIMFLPKQPKGQIKMCSTHSLPVCLIFLETKARCERSIFFLPLIHFTWKSLEGSKQYTQTNVSDFESLSGKLPNLGLETSEVENHNTDMRRCRSKEYKEGKGNNLLSKQK